MLIYFKTAKADQTWPNMILLPKRVHASGGGSFLVIGLRLDDIRQGGAQDPILTL